MFLGENGNSNKIVLPNLNSPTYDHSILKTVI